MYLMRKYQKLQFLERPFQAGFKIKSIPINPLGKMSNFSGFKYIFYTSYDNNYSCVHPLTWPGLWESMHGFGYASCSKQQVMNRGQRRGTCIKKKNTDLNKGTDKWLTARHPQLI